MNILNSIFGGRIRIANQLLHVACSCKMYVNKSLTKSFWNIKLKPLQCPFSLCLKALIPFQPGSPKQYFPLGSSEPCVVVASHHCDHWRKLRHLCTRADCSFGFALSAIRSIRSRQNWGVCCRNDVRLRLFHLGHGLMHDMGSIDPFPLVLLVRAGAWFAVFGKSTTPCILMAGTWNKSQKHLPPVASSQSSLRSFVSVDVCWFPCPILSSSILQCKECLRGKRAHQFSKSHLENDFQTISVVHSEIANAMSEPNYCTCDSVWCTHKTEACLVFFFWFWHPYFPYSCFIIFHVFYCFFCMFLYGFRAECIKQPEFYSGLRVENNLRCEPTGLNFPWEKIPIFVGQKCKSQVLQPLFALKQSGPWFF